MFVLLSCIFLLGLITTFYIRKNEQNKELFDWLVKTMLKQLAKRFINNEIDSHVDDEVEFKSF